MTDDAKTAGGAGKERPAWAAGSDKAAAGAGKEVNKEEEHRRAEERMRVEMARQRREEERSLKAVKLGCITIIVVLVLALVAGFML